jgi:hypothetical protein
VEEAKVENQGRFGYLINGFLSLLQQKKPKQAFMGRPASAGVFNKDTNKWEFPDDSEESEDEVVAPPPTTKKKPVEEIKSEAT